mgnify:FL=1
MYELAKDRFDHGRTIPKGTPLSDVYELPGRFVAAIAHIWGKRIKLTLVPSELALRKPKD